MPKMKSDDEISRLEQAMADLHERIGVEKSRRKSRDALIRFVEGHPLLTKGDVMMVARTMKPPNARKLEEAKAAHRGGNGGANKGKRMGPSKNMKPAKGKLGKAVRAARLAAGLTTKELATKIGLKSGVNITLIERGYGAGQNTGRKVVELLKLSPDLLGRSKMNGAEAH